MRIAVRRLGLRSPAARLALFGLLACALGALPAAAVGPHKAIGQVTALDTSAHTITVLETGASKPTTVTFSDRTHIAEGMTRLAASDLETGQQVSVTYQPVSSGVPKALRIDILERRGPNTGHPIEMPAHTAEPK